MGLTAFGLLVIIFGLLYLTARGELKGKRRAYIPAAMRPGASDEALEKRVLERYLIVGAVATMVMAIWLPGYWLREPTRLDNKRAAFEAAEVAEGEELYASLCAQCHGQDGEGLPRLVPLNGEQVNVAEPPLKYIWSRYRAAMRSDDEIYQLVYEAIAKGRPGTVMPTWLVAYGGSLNSAQVENVILYIQSIQDEYPEPDADATGEELFDANCAICHGPGGSGEGGVGPNLRVALERLSLEELHEVLYTGRLNTNRYSMPSWAVLGEDALDKLVNYVVGIQEG